MFGGGLAPAHQVIKKLKMDHLWVYTLLACVAWRFWLLSNKGGRGQKNREEKQGFLGK